MKKILWKIKNGLLSLNEVPNEFLNEEVILEAVRLNGYALGYVPINLKNNKNIVLEAINQNGMAIEYASDDMKNDKEIAMAAVSKNGNAIQYLSNELKNDREIVLAAIRKNGLTIGYTELRNDKELALEAINESVMSFTCLPKTLLNDIDIMRNVIKQNYLLLNYNIKMFDKIYDDKESVKYILYQNVEEYKFVSDRLKMDDEIIRLSIFNRDIEELPSKYKNAISKFPNGDRYWSYLSGLLVHRERMKRKYHPDNIDINKLMKM